MSTKRKSKALPIGELAERYKRQVLETARRAVAMRRTFPGQVVRFRRAATTGPNAEDALLFTWTKGEQPQVHVVPHSEIEEMAVTITDADLFQEMSKFAEAAEHKP